LTIILSSSIQEKNIQKPFSWYLSAMNAQIKEALKGTLSIVIMLIDMIADECG